MKNFLGKNFFSNLFLAATSFPRRQDKIKLKKILLQNHVLPKTLDKKYFRNFFGRILFFFCKIISSETVWMKIFTGRKFSRNFFWLQNHFLGKSWEQKIFEKIFWFKIYMFKGFYLVAKSFPRKVWMKKFIGQKFFCRNFLVPKLLSRKQFGWKFFVKLFLVKCFCYCKTISSETDEIKKSFGQKLFC